MIPSEYYRMVRRNPSLVVYYRLNELSGTTAVDRAGKYNLNGIYINSPNNGPSLICPVNNEIGSFAPASKEFGKSAGQQMEVPDATVLHMTAGLALEAWVIAFKTKQNVQIISKMNSAGTFDNPYNLRLREGKPSFGTGNGTTNVFATSSVEIPIGIPVHLMGSYYRKNLYIYVNGVTVGETSLGTQNITDGGQPLLISASTTPESTRFDGLISEVAIYNNGISQRTAKEHFDLGRQIIFKKPYYNTYDPPSYS
jgi:hypothetical protein